MHTAFALAQAAKVPAFNETFYSVAATIIPVLFLALAVQGPFLDELLSLADRPRARSSRPARALASTYAADAPWRVGVFVVIFSTVGEILAIVALYQQHATETGGSITLTGVILLVVLTAFKPTLAVFAHSKAPARDADSDPEPAKPDGS
jgi:hypothetical protein